MKAVNLIPAESAAGSGRSPVGVYALLGTLALLVAMSAAYTLVGRSVDSKRSELAAVTAQAAGTEAKATQYKTYSDFSQLRQARVETVKKLAASRFDWATAMHEVARTMPAGSWVTSLRATVDPSAQVDGTTDQLRGAIPSPAIELAGCSTSQRGVAGVVSALRGISGVQRVTLSSSQKAQSAQSGSGSSDSAGASNGCDARPAFSLTVFFTAPGGSTTAAGTTAATTATASGATTP
jgi:Tfp pilus assembly protein PilN